MSLLEFDVIKQYFSKIRNTGNHSNIHLGIGDDAAIVSVPKDNKLVICTDTLNQGIHFPLATSAYDIAYKALAVNLSDMAAMGAQPSWFTLNISMPTINKGWLEGFSKGLTTLAKQYQLDLIGGDTTRGPLSISITLAGHIHHSQALTRANAQAGDRVYLTGCTGEAAYGLRCVSGSKPIKGSEQYFVSRLNRPTPRVALGLSLVGIANACIDVSDGLLADISHIAEASQCGFQLYLNDIPLP
ncbi:thiamine-phosphate kinase, partial [Beggiatoa alba]|nr:thiamine-phosphate kinase [Beggiatoa alba]